jgi:hypothetical protein
VPFPRSLLRASSSDTSHDRKGVVSHKRTTSCAQSASRYCRQLYYTPLEFFSPCEDLRSVCTNHQCLVSSLRIHHARSHAGYLLPPRSTTERRRCCFLLTLCFDLCSLPFSASPRLRGEIFSSRIGCAATARWGRQSCPQPAFSRRLLVPEGHHRVQPRRAPRRPDPEEQAC